MAAEYKSVCLQSSPAPSPVPDPSPAPKYVMSAWGQTCPAGTESLTTRAQCEAAAAQLSHSPTKINHDMAFSHIPAGCAVQTDQLIWSTGTGTSMAAEYKSVCLETSP